MTNYELEYLSTTSCQQLQTQLNVTFFLPACPTSIDIDICIYSSQFYREATDDNI